jgi:DNA invertase Pin-like site-specific DNA recombinase
VVEESAECMLVLIVPPPRASGTTTEGREALRTVLEFLHAGDVLMTRIDRPARSIGDVQDIVRTVRARGATRPDQPIDTSTAAGKCFLDMLGVFAEFETNLRRERQREGNAKAKAAGVYKRVRELKAQGMRGRSISPKRSRLVGRRPIGCSAKVLSLKCRSGGLSFGVRSTDIDRRRRRAS